jgi:two-component system, cell cycle sensor histidine kinase and response regulator CckA
MLLLVEDDAISRTSFAELLRREGHKVIEASDGAEAIRLLELWPINLVITDLVLPNVNGMSLIKRIHARWRNMPVILISGYLSQRAGENILSNNATFFGKPVRPSALAIA